VEDHVDDVGSEEAQVDQDKEDTYSGATVLEVQDHLAEKTAMYEHAHKDNPVWNQKVFALLLVTNVWQKEKDYRNN